MATKARGSRAARTAYPTAMLLMVIVIGYEEPPLRDVFGEPYRRCCTEASRWFGVPRR